MAVVKKIVGPTFVTLGIILLIIGFVQQEFTLSFESGMFNMGLIFFLSGLVATAIEKKIQKK